MPPNDSSTLQSDRVSVRGKLSPHAGPSVSLTGTACSCQAAMSLLISVWQLLWSQPPTQSPAPPLHNTNKPEKPPLQVPEITCAYFRLREDN